MIKISAVGTAQEYAHEAVKGAKKDVKGAVGNDLIQIVAVVGFLGLFGGGLILGLDTMLQAVDNDSQAHDFIDQTIGAFDIVPQLLEVVVVFGFISVLIGLLWMGMRRMGLNQQIRGGL